MKLKQLFARFRDWQRNPFHFKPMARAAHYGSVSHARTTRM